MRLTIVVWQQQDYRSLLYYNIISNNIMILCVWAYYQYVYVYHTRLCRKMSYFIRAVALKVINRFIQSFYTHTYGWVLILSIIYAFYKHAQKFIAVDKNTILIIIIYTCIHTYIYIQVHDTRKPENTNAHIIINYFKSSFI